jgi:hypothetical protein
MIAYGWVINVKTNLAGPVVTLFLTGYTTTGTFSSLNTLIIDINVESPAIAVAASSLIRCHFGASAVTTIVPLIDIIGMGWACTTVAGIWLAISHICGLCFGAVTDGGNEKRPQNEEQTGH